MYLYMCVYIYIGVYIYICIFIYVATVLVSLDATMRSFGSTVEDTPITKGYPQLMRACVSPQSTPFAWPEIDFRYWDSATRGLMGRCQPTSSRRCCFLMSLTGVTHPSAAKQLWMLQPLPHFHRASLKCVNKLSNPNHPRPPTTISSWDASPYANRP